jgi:large subunit ribosomal protein L29
MKASEIRALSMEEMVRKISDLKQELFNLRFQHGAGQLENPRKIKQTQKDIARIYTVISDIGRNPREAQS